MGIGKRIKEARIDKGLKQSDLAAMIGVTASAIGNYENGVSVPKTEIMYKLFSALDCDANYLYQDDIPELLKGTDIISGSEKQLVHKYRLLNPFGQEKADEYIEDLLDNPKYKDNTHTQAEKSQTA